MADERRSEDREEERDEEVHLKPGGTGGGMAHGIEAKTKKRRHVDFASVGPGEHALESSYCLSFFKRPPGKFNPEEYADHVQPIAIFYSVEQFWRVYAHLKRPSDVNDKVDFHLFKTGIKPVWEDDANCNGGKWIIRLKKDLASRIWENLILAMLGEQFMVGEELCGAVCSIRNQEDIVSLWNRTASNLGVTKRIRDTMIRVCNLPPSTLVEYKQHDDCLKDQTSYRNTDVYRR